MCENKEKLLSPRVSTISLPKVLDHIINEYSKPDAFDSFKTKKENVLEALIIACKLGRVDVIRELRVLKSKEIVSELIEVISPLGDVAILKELRDNWGLSKPQARNAKSLQLACKHGHLPFVKELIAWGLKSNIRDGNNYALRMAARNGHLSVVQELKKLGLTKKDVILKLDHGHVDYMIVSSPMYDGHTEIVKEFRLNWGVTKADFKDQHILRELKKKIKKIDMIEELQNWGYDLEIPIVQEDE